MMKRFIYISLVLIILSVFAVSYSIHEISPVEMTNTAITETFVRMSLYSRQESKVPENLEVLPEREGYINRIYDGWGRKLIYIKEENILTLKSLGMDGRFGGEGKNKDISKSYFIRKSDGDLWIGDDMWIVEAEKK